MLSNHPALFGSFPYILDDGKVCSWLVWLPPTPTMAVSEVPSGESQGPMESLIAMDQGIWRLEGTRMCTSHHLDSRTKQFNTFVHLSQDRF